MHLGERATTGWLKLKYSTGKNAISRQPCEILFYAIFSILHGIINSNL